MDHNTTQGPTTFGIPITDQNGSSPDVFHITVGETAATIKIEREKARKALSEKEWNRRKAKRKQAKISKRRNR